LTASANADDRFFRRCGDVRYRVVGGQAVIIVQDAGEAIVLNEVGTRVLELIDQNLSSSQIAEALCEHFEVEIEQASSDLESYLGDLQEAGVIAEIDSDD
jgi:hypothetical protein